ncbi:MAG TPA: YCF48-related protein [Sediminibacterium sp.]|nr:YCF48-related protein [Sediminibacterium sp.]
MRVLLSIILFCCLSNLPAQTNIRICTSGTHSSLRGLHVVSEDIVWASGSNGYVARTTNGGLSFTWMQVKGYEKRDFRDIMAWDSLHALILAVDQPGILLETTDGGKTWDKVWEDQTPGIFMDAMAFAGSSGFVIGDPIGGRAYLLYSNDSGHHWQKADSSFCPALEAGEAFFASSGTNLVLLGQGQKKQACFVSGGTVSAIYLPGNQTRKLLPLQQGGTSTGANSIAYNPRTGRVVVVGGDFSRDSLINGNCALAIIQQGRIGELRNPRVPPHGYRSAVCWVNDKRLICCGTSGIDISEDRGNSWTLVFRQSFHACSAAPGNKTAWLAGNGGRIARWQLP